MKREIVEEDELVVIRGEAEGQAEVVDAEDFHVYMYLSEKAMTIAFPQENGSFDYKGFTSRDPVVLRFCKDLFIHYWDESDVIPRNEIVQRHIEYLNKHGIRPKYP